MFITNVFADAHGDLLDVNDSIRGAFQVCLSSSLLPCITADSCLLLHRFREPDFDGYGFGFVADWIGVVGKRALPAHPCVFIPTHTILEPQNTAPGR